MEKYLGVKLINAEQCSQDQFAGAKNPGDLSKLAGTYDVEGYRVVYEDGYTSWSPKEVFEKAYRKIDGLTFGLAIEALKQGKCIARKGWNGKGMYLYLQEGTLLTQPARNAILLKYQEEQGSEPVKINSHIDMKTADGSITIGWLASQTDMLAEDWFILD